MKVEQLDGVTDAPATVTAVQPQGPYTYMAFEAPHVATAAEPGQFVMVETSSPGSQLRRPFSLLGADPDTGVIELLFAAWGEGTSWLARQMVGTSVRIMGPLGTRYQPGPGDGHIVVVAGGYGVAPLGWLATRVSAAGRRVHAIAGAATADRLALPDSLVAHASPLDIATVDGSRGTQGIVTDLLPAALDGAASVHACGPMPMLRAVGDMAAAHGVPVEVAVEEHMACGFGVCMTCVIPTRDDDGTPNRARACIDGPVMDARLVDWEASRWA